MASTSIKLMDVSPAPVPAGLVLQLQYASLAQLPDLPRTQSVLVLPDVGMDSSLELKHVILVIAIPLDASTAKYNKDLHAVDNPQFARPQDQLQLLHPPLRPHQLPLLPRPQLLQEEPFISLELRV